MTKLTMDDVKALRGDPWNDEFADFLLDLASRIEQSLSSEPSRLTLRESAVCLEAAILLERYAEKEGNRPTWLGKQLIEELRALGSSEPSAPPSDSRKARAFTEYDAEVCNRAAAYITELSGGRANVTDLLLLKSRIEATL